MYRSIEGKEGTKWFLVKRSGANIYYTGYNSKYNHVVPKIFTKSHIMAAVNRLNKRDYLGDKKELDSYGPWMAFEIVNFILKPYEKDK